MKKQIPYFLILVIWLISCQQKENSISNLIKSNWSFKAVDDSIWLPATVPGYVHLDLLNNNLIEDPYYRLNEHNQQWIDKKDWEYRTTFNVDGWILEKDVVELNFKGLDTYANVYLNDKLILMADNMFTSYVVSCKDILKATNNKLKVILESPIKIGLEKREKLGYFLPGAENDQSELGGLGDIKVSIFTRKPGYHFGWDWGPRLVSSGIWQDIELVAWNKATIADVNIVQDKLSDSKAELIAEIEVLSTTALEAKILCKIDSENAIEQKVSLLEGINKINIPIAIQKPELWWTNGLGSQKLYDFEIELFADSKLLSAVSKNVGLRTVELIQQPDSIGKSFYFSVNGNPVFMKGANYIPQDIFLSRVADDDYERLIKSAADANFNMLRV